MQLMTGYHSMKTLITKAQVLHYYDVGLGAVITEDGYPIAYASRMLNQTESNYAQIEKECPVHCLRH